MERSVYPFDNHGVITTSIDVINLIRVADLKGTSWDVFYTWEVYGRVFSYCQAGRQTEVTTTTTTNNNYFNYNKNNTSTREQ